MAENAQTNADLPDLYQKRIFIFSQRRNRFMNACTDVSTDEELLEALESIIALLPRTTDRLIQVLAKVQKHLGYLPKWAQARVAQGLWISLQEVCGVVTFYAYFSLIPKWRHKVRICAGTACYVLNFARVGGLQSQGAKGEAVVGYREPLATRNLKSSGTPEG
jgi:hypothetical protein